MDRLNHILIDPLSLLPDGLHAVTQSQADSLRAPQRRAAGARRGGGRARRVGRRARELFGGEAEAALR